VVKEITVHDSKIITNYEDNNISEPDFSCGFILLDKPHGPTSHQVTAWVRESLGLKRLGHGGTLDPFATGVLPLMFGKAVRLTGMILEHNKEYIALFRFSSEIEEDELKSCLKRLSGKIFNTPPEISAVKVQVRTRKILDVELLEIENKMALVRIHCEAGTYIRTYAKDIGLIMGKKCELIELRRTRSGIFSEDTCVTLSQLADAVWKWKKLSDPKALMKILYPLNKLVSEIPQVVIAAGAISAIAHGAPLMRPGIISMSQHIKKGERVTLVKSNGEIIAIANSEVSATEILEMENGIVAQPGIVFALAEDYPPQWKKKQIESKD